jgi:hypothetical protein
MRPGASFIKIGKAILYPLEELDRWDRRNAKPENARQMGEQHLDVLSAMPGAFVSWCFCY